VCCSDPVPQKGSTSGINRFFSWLGTGLGVSDIKRQSPPSQSVSWSLSIPNGYSIIQRFDRAATAIEGRSGGNSRRGSLQPYVAVTGLDITIIPRGARSGK
jgi:hypothetical protein